MERTFQYIRPMARTIAFDEEATLDKVMDLFWSTGYADTSAQDLVDRTGLSRSSLYNSFGDKHALFLCVLQRYRVRESARLITFLETSAADVASIRTLLTSVVEASRAKPKGSGCFMVNTAVELGAKDAAVRRILHDNMDEVVAALHGFIQRGQRAGTLRTGDAQGLALALFHTITALRVTTKAQRHPAFYTAFIDAQLHLFNP